MTYNEIIRKYLDFPPEKRLSVAKASLEDARRILANTRDDVDADGQISIVVAACLGVGGRIPAEALALLRELLGYDADSGFVETIYYNREMNRLATDRIIQPLAKRERAPLFSLCLCFAVADGEVTPAEMAFLGSLVE